MNLTEYNNICAQMGAYCERVYRQENIDGKICPRVSACDVQTLEGYELELMKGYNTNFSDIKLELDKMKDNAPGVNEVERYHQNFAIYGTIQALIDDIKANKVYCPQKAQKRLIGSLERLYQMFFSISRMCFAEFEKIREETVYHKNITFQELQEGKPEALEAFWGLLCSEEKDCLDTNHKWVPGCYQSYLARVIQTIENQFPGSDRKGIAKFLGVKDYQVRNAKSYYPEK